MNIQEAKEIIKIADNSGDVPLLVGLHGIGKSEGPEQYAKETALYFEPLILSLMDTGDMLGMPDTKDVGGLNSTIWNAPSWYSNIVNAAWPNELETDCLVFKDKEFESFVKRARVKSEFFSRSELNLLFCNHFEVPNDRIQLLRQEAV